MATFEGESIVSVGDQQANHAHFMSMLFTGESVFITGNSEVIATAYIGSYISEYDSFVRRYTG